MALSFPSFSSATTVSGTSATFTLNDPPPKVTAVKIATPQGLVFISNEMTIIADGDFPDGGYQYELIGELPTAGGTIMPEDSIEDNGRSEAALGTPVGILESGDFRIVNGTVIDTKTLKEN